MPRKHINECSEEELRFFAETVLQAELIDCPTVGHVIGVIRQLHEDEYLNLPERLDSVQNGAVQPLAKVLRARGGRDFGPPVSLTLLETDQIAGKHPAEPSVNGIKIVIQRNMRVTIPYAFYLNLRNAKQTLTVPNPKALTPEGENDPMTIKVTVTNYPMQDVELPPRQDILDWHAKEGHKELAATHVADVNEEREAA